MLESCFKMNLNCSTMKKTFYSTLLFTLVFYVTGCGNPEKAPGTTAATSAKNTPAAVKTKTIVFFGNSLTAGYGLSSPTQAFPAVIQTKIDSLGLPYNVVNAGVSGETTSGGASRIDWILRQPLDVFI